MICIVERNDFELVREIIKNSDFPARKSWPKPLCDMAVDGLCQEIWTGYGIFDIGHELLSYLDYRVRSPNLIEIGICCTRKDNRRQGLMKSLFCHLIETYPHCEIIIGTAEHNHPMINCIQSMGFLRDYIVPDDRVDGSASIHYKQKGEGVEQF